MKNNNTTLYSGIKAGKSLLCLAVLSSLGMSLPAIAAELATQNGVIKAPAKQSVLKLGNGFSVLGDALAQNTSVKSFQQSELAGTSVADAVGAAKYLHINLADFKGYAPTLDSYVAEAMSQGKLMVFENITTADLQLEALPFMVEGDIVLFKPNASGKDQIFVYGGGHKVVEHQVFEHESAPGKPLKSVLKVDENGNSKTVERIDTPKLKDMNEQDLTLALSSIERKVAELSGPAGRGGFETAKTTIASATGGAIGYECPTLALNEQLCWAAVVTNLPYFHSDGDAEINIINNYSVAMYRTNQYTSIGISPNGSANPNMKKDSGDEKAYFLKYFEVDITPDLNDMSLWYRYPQNENQKSTVTSTSGMSYGISGDVSESGPSLGGSITYSESNSVATTITDWESITRTTGYNAKTEFKLNKYKSISDWVDAGFFDRANFKSTPNISKYGLQYTSEGVWVSDKNKDGTIEFDLKTVTQNSSLRFTSRNVFGDWSATESWWTHTVYPGSYWMNRSWLKNL